MANGGLDKSNIFVSRRIIIKEFRRQIYFIDIKERI
jgi:hypothetical protein